MAKKIKSTRLELTESKVVFNEEKHTYSLDGKFLSGITGMLQRQLFPEEYANVDEATLNAAAEYGTGVHKSCEEWDMNWYNDGTQEVNDYIQICADNNLVHERSEYLVSDNKDWASCIDKVFRLSDDEFALGDLKTYGQMTPEKREKARWQLSIYAYLFELNNKKAKVDHLFIIHLRCKTKRTGVIDHIANIIPVKRIPAEICKELLDTDKAGGKFQNPYAIPDEVMSQEDRIRTLIETKKRCEEELEQIKAKILADMEAADQKTWATETMRLTRTLPSTRTTFDSKKFKEDHPDMDLSAYEKVSVTSGSLKITI